MNIYKRTELQSDYFYIYSGNLIFPKLFDSVVSGISTDVYVINPDNTNPTDPQWTAEQLQAFKATYTSTDPQWNFTEAAAPLTDTNWTAKGWDVNNLQEQLRDWVNLNFAYGPINPTMWPMNLVIGKPIIEDQQYYMAFCYFGNQGDLIANFLIDNESAPIVDNEGHFITV